MTPPPHRPLPWAVLIGLVGGVFVAGTLAVALAPHGNGPATFWPATAIGVMVLALNERRRWPVLAAALAGATLLAELAGGRDPRLAIAHAVLETIGALGAAALLSDQGRRRPTLADQDDFVRLLGAALVSGTLIALGGLPALAIGSVDLDPLWVSLLTVLATHAAAVLVLVPLALVEEARWAGRVWELAIQVVLLGGAAVLTFVPEHSSALTFAPGLFLVWAALRFDMRVAVGELALFGTLATALNLHDAGPFHDLVGRADVDHLAAGALTQAYLACLALLILPLGIAVQREALLMARITADGRLFRRNFTESLVGMAFLEPDAGGTDLVIADLNDTASEILDGDPDDLLGLRLREVLDTGSDYDEVVAKLLAGSLDGWRAECPLVGASGRAGSGRVTLHIAMLSEPGDAPLFAAQILDVTTEYEARRQLEMAQQLNSATLDTTACIIMVTDLDGVVVRVNAATSEITGYREGDLLGRKVWDTGIAPSEGDGVEALLAWPNRSGVPIMVERDARTRSGENLRIVWNTNIVRNEDDEPVYIVMTGIDVTAERTTRGLVNHLMEASFTTALVGIDTSGRISVVNSGLTHLLGYDRDELIGEPFHRLLEPVELLERTGSDNPRDAFEILVRGLSQDGETRARDWTWVTKAGAEQLVSMTLSIAQDAFAAQSGYLCVARDVAEQRNSQEMLIGALDRERTAVERLRSLDAAKNEFVSTVSHELRTPVTSIVGYTEMMQDGSICAPLPDQLPLLETIHRNGQRLISMINDLLTLSGLDSDTVHWRQDPVDLASIVGPVEEAIRPLLLGRVLELDIERPMSAVPILGDRAQIERVMINLLSNAVKFTEDGGRIGFGVAIDEDEAVVEVSDSGIGIPADEQADLFQRFFRSSTAQARQIQGTGLGLSIVSEIVAGHGGTIDVRSGHLQGATFTVRLPLARSARLTPAG